MSSNAFILALEHHGKRFWGCHASESLSVASRRPMDYYRSKILSFNQRILYGIPEYEEEFRTTLSSLPEESAIVVFDKNVLKKYEKDLKRLFKNLYTIEFVHIPGDPPKEFSFCMDSKVCMLEDNLSGFAIKIIPA